MAETDPLIETHESRRNGVKEVLKRRCPTLIWFIYLFFDLSRTFPSLHLYNVTTRPLQVTAFIGWPNKKNLAVAQERATRSHLMRCRKFWFAQRQQSLAYRSVSKLTLICKFKEKLWTFSSVWHMWSILLIRAPPTQAAWLLHANPLNPSFYCPVSTACGKSNFWLGLCSLELHNIYITSALASPTCWPHDLDLLSLNSDLRAIHPLHCQTPPCGSKRTDVHSLTLW